MRRLLEEGRGNFIRIGSGAAETSARRGIVHLDEKMRPYLYSLLARAQENQ